VGLDLGRQVGPLPLGAWLAVVAGGLFIGWQARKGGAGSSPLPNLPSGVLPSPDNAPPVISPVIELHYPTGQGAPSTTGEAPAPADTGSNPYGSLMDTIAAMFAHAGRPIATATETRQQRLERIAREVAGGQRSLSGNDPNSVANALTWEKAHLQTGPAVTSSVPPVAPIPGVTRPVPGVHT